MTAPGSGSTPSGPRPRAKWWRRGRRRPLPAAWTASGAGRPQRAASAASTGENQVQGRQRVLLVDTAGPLLAVVVRPANWADPTGGEWVLKLARWRFAHLTLIWVDAGGAGEPFAVAVAPLRRFRPEVAGVRRDPRQVGFAVQPRRWVVERTLAGQGRARRLSQEDERLPESSARFIYLAAMRRNLRLLAAQV